MAKIGTLQVRCDDNGRLHARGAFSTLSVSMQIWLTPLDDESESTNAPTHRVKAKGHAGYGIEVGSAWQRKITRGQWEGELFFGIQVDDPSLPEPLNLSAFPNSRTDLVPGARWELDIVWGRPRKKVQESPQSGGAADPNSVEGGEYDIPF